MRFNYLIYPKAQELLEVSGLLKRVKKANESKEGLPFIGATSDDEIVRDIREMKQQGYFETIPSSLRKTFMNRLQTAFKDKEAHKWKAHRNGQVIEEDIEPEDFYLMSGYLSSFILGKRQIWDYKKFGFESLDDFVGCLGAAVWSSNRTLHFGGYEWITQTLDGRVFKNNISGDHNLDFRIYQLDISPDKTINPLEAEVSYRPEFRQDNRCVAAYHSTEQYFLVGVLKWIDQEKIPCEMLKDNGRPLIEYTKSLGHTIGPATECYGGSYGMDSPMIVLNSFYEPIPVLDENFSTDKPTFDGLFASPEGCFGMYVGPNKELVFSYQSKEQRDVEKKINACFLPSEADHLLKGVCYQAAKGLGRTVPQKLIRLIEYRFSNQMAKDIAEMMPRK